MSHSSLESTIRSIMRGPVKEQPDAINEAKMKESHYKVGDDVIYKGQEGEIVKIDEPQTGKYYTVELEDGVTVKASSDELMPEDEVDDDDDDEDEDEKMNEKAVSQAQQKAAGIALAAKRSEIPKSQLQPSSKAMMGMSTKELEKFAKTKHAGLPTRKEEIEVTEGRRPKPKDENEPEKQTKTKDFLVKFEKGGSAKVRTYSGTSELDVRSKANVDAKRMGMAIASIRLREDVELEEAMKEFGTKFAAMTYARQHGGKVMKKTFTNPRTGIQTVSYVVKEEIEVEVQDTACAPIEEAVSVKKQNYSWGKMVTVHHGAETSYPLHPEHQAKIKALGDGEKTSFKDETKRTVTAHRVGDQIHLSGAGTSKKTPVARSHFMEEVELDELSKSTLGSYVKKAASDARFKQGIGKDYEALGKRKRDPDTKALFARMGRKLRMKAQDREAGIGKAVDRLTKEEAEQVDELSRNTLSSYVSKASDARKHQGMPTSKVDKRYSGVAKATGKLDKMNKEGVNEVKSAPKGFHFTKDGKLKRGDADQDGSGGPMLRSDPLDKQRSKVPPVSEKIKDLMARAMKRKS